MLDLLNLTTIQKITKFMVLLAIMNMILIATQVLIISKLQVTPNEVQEAVLVNRGIEISNTEKLDRILERLAVNETMEDSQ